MLSNWGETQGGKALLPPLTKLNASVRLLTSNISANPRLQFGLIVILAMLLVTGVLDLMDLRDAEIKKLASAQESVRSLKSALGGGARQRQLEKELDVARDQVDIMLWHARKPVIAQADFTDWLSSILVDVGVRQPAISQPSYRYLDDSSSDERPASSNKDGRQGAASTGKTACKSGACNLVELRASLRIAYDPATLNKALAAIEGADRLVIIEQLGVNPAERRVEMTVRSYAVMDAHADDGEAADDTEASQLSAEPGPVVAPANEGPAEQKKPVEIKW